MHFSACGSGSRQDPGQSGYGSTVFVPTNLKSSLLKDYHALKKLPALKHEVFLLWDPFFLPGSYFAFESWTLSLKRSWFFMERKSSSWNQNGSFQHHYCSTSHTGTFLNSGGSPWSRGDLTWGKGGSPWGHESSWAMERWAGDMGGSDLSHGCSKFS